MKKKIKKDKFCLAKFIKKNKTEKKKIYIRSSQKDKSIKENTPRFMGSL